ncbi:MAG TPA: hypothetical protein QF695_09330, partial [Arenicellales bacterium]|nr:hypothetical protein [Arenicellales bacterium]
CHGLPSQHYLYGLYSSYSSLILSGNDELKPSLRQSDLLVQLMLTGYTFWASLGDGETDQV